MTAANPFAAGGDAYARYRPDYPPELAGALAGLAPSHGLALDVGCGSGQFSVQLAGAFERVVAVDPSAGQIAHAVAHPYVDYRVGRAEALEAALAAEDGRPGLIAAAQAAHWFELPAFYAGVRRVAAPGAVVALVSYGVARIDGDAANARFARFYHGDIGRFWPAERRLVDEGYRGIDFPFREVTPPAMDIVRAWSAADFLGYVTTWSAVRAAREAGAGGLVAAFGEELAALWGDGLRTVRWPVAMRVGMV